MGINYTQHFGLFGLYFYCFACVNFSPRFVANDYDMINYDRMREKVRIQGFKADRIQGTKADRIQGTKADRIQGIKAYRIQGNTRN